jgi:hypothetical protein
MKKLLIFILLFFSLSPRWRGLAVRADRYPAKRHGLQAHASEVADGREVDVKRMILTK